MSGMRLQLLGPFAATLGTRPVTRFALKKAQALLIYLACNPEPHQRESLMLLLWPDMSQASAQKNLRQTLYRLRQAIPECPAENSLDPVPLILSDRRAVQFNPQANCEVDVHTFTRLLKAGRAHWPDAVALYREDFLSDFYLPDSTAFEEWAMARRANLRQRVLDALDALVEDAWQAGDLEQAEAYARRQLTIDSLHEGAHRQLMRLLDSRGQRSQALAQYKLCRQLLLQELGVEPDPQTQALFEHLRAATPAAQSARTDQIRGYDLREAIGSGSFGVVHRAYQPVVGREVAIKIILPQYANQPDFIRRFEVEAQIVARLEHPHIVPLYDFWREPDAAFLVMRWMSGGSLHGRLAQGAWPSEAAAPLVDQIASALYSAHRQGIVHQDIKPANILLDEEGNAYLSDFGIAKGLVGFGWHTPAGTGLSTPIYMAPEQLLDQEVTPAADIFCLGLLLYHLLTGQYPFARTPLAALLRMQEYEGLPSVRQQCPELPPAVDEVIQQATDYNPQNRFPDALSLAAAFRQVAGEPSGFHPVPTLAPVNPYKGLRAFQEVDQADFFGREALINELLDKLNVAEQPDPPGEESVDTTGRFLTVVGPSGSGKSSVLGAGLMPLLRHGAVPGSDKWFVIKMLPGPHPLEELEAGLLHIATHPPATLLDLLQQDERGLIRAVKQLLPQDENATLLLIIDQFEELFTLVQDRAVRRHFINNLRNAVMDTRIQIRVLLALRADFYDRPLNDPSLGDLVRRHTVAIAPLTDEELERAICAPAEQRGVAVEEALLVEMMHDVSEQPGALPLLQYTLTQLFQHQAGNQMSLEGYHQLGGVLGALGRRAEEIYETLDDTGRQAVRQLFLRLVTLGDGVEDTRRRVLRSELETLYAAGQKRSEPGASLSPTTGSVLVQTMLSPEAAQMRAVIDAFGHYRLLTFDRDPLNRQPTVEVAHEALLRRWPRLRNWLEESRDDIRRQRLLATAASEWQESQQDASYLLRGAHLDQFEAWSAATDLALTAAEQQFLDASLEEQRQRRAEAEARRQRELEAARQLADSATLRAEEQAISANRLRRRAYALAGALLVAAVLAAMAVAAGRQANRNAQEAQDNFWLAATRETEAIVNAEERAVQQAVAEEQRQLALLQAGIGLASRALLEMEGNYPERGPLLALEALEQYPYSWQAERALGQTVIGQYLRLVVTHQAAINSSAWSPDGNRLATAGDDGVVQVWEVTSGQLLYSLEIGERVGQALWSPSGDRLLTNGRRAQIWDANSGQLRLTLGEDGQFVEYADWSPSGDRIVTVGQESMRPQIWDASSGTLLQTLAGHAAPVHICADLARCTSGISAWSPDGERLLTYDDDGHLIVWSVATGTELLRHSVQGRLVSATWSPSGKQILLAAGRLVQVVDVATGETVLSLEDGHEVYGLNGAYWSPTGDRILTFGLLSNAKLWDATSGQQLAAYSQDSLLATWSPDGRQIANAKVGDTTVTIWQVESGAALHTFRGHSWDVTNLSWSSSGQRIASASGDGTARIWELDNPLLRLEIAESSDYLAVWSPDSQHIARPYEDGQFKLFDGETGRLELAIQSGHQGRFGVNWSPSGRRLLTAGWDGYARVWDTQSGELLTTLIGHQGRIFERVGWSPDEARVATSGIDDGVVRIWDAATGEILLEFTDQIDEAPVHSPYWSPDGQWLVSASWGGSAKIWDPDTGRVLHDLYPPDFGFQIADTFWSPDSASLVSFAADGMLRIVDARTGQEVLAIEALADFPRWFPAGDRILAAGGRFAVRIWDVNTGNELLAFDVPNLYQADLAPNGRKFLVSTWPDGTLKVYDIWQSKAELMEIARQCCLLRPLTAGERQQFGLQAQPEP